MGEEPVPVVGVEEVREDVGAETALGAVAPRGAAAALGWA
jgi:hypothetical protein